MNKGKEAMAYLTYIIEHYETLPSTIAFVHSHKDGYPAGWHTDAEGNSNVNSLKNLNIDFVQRNGYANLRCIWFPGCPDEVKPYRTDIETNPEKGFETRIPKIYEYLFHQKAPELLATPCCAQFAVSRTQVQKRSLDEYVRFRQWLIDVDVSDFTSGWFFEYIWHVIFGQQGVYCPDIEQCYCDVYSRC